MNIFISFSGDADLDIVKKQLEKVFEIEDRKLGSEDFNYYHCFLPRNVVEERGGMDTKIVDFLDKMFKGRNIINLLEHEGCHTYEKCMKKIDSIRKEYFKNLDYEEPYYDPAYNNYIDHMYVLGMDITEGLIKEIKFASGGKIIIMK